MNLTNPLVYGAPIFIALIAIELSYSKTKDNKKLYNWKDLLSSLSLGIGSAVIGALMKTVSMILVFNFAYELFNPIVDGVRSNIMGWDSFGYAWYIWIFCMLLDDYTYYWFHRQNHMV
ncbi:MAG: C-5 sterol desaturase, partial [Psychroflexus sp.]|nr:C-5 sterol desaturase [Psychroflexus sp.]